MTSIIQAAVLGLGAGAVTALLAQGLVAIYGGSGVLNFAQAAIAMLGAYTFWELHVNQSWPFWPALLVTLGATALLGAVTYQLIMRRLRNASTVARTVASLGLLTIIQGAVSLKWGQVPRSINAIFPAHLYMVGSVGIPADRLYLLGVAFVLTAVLSGTYRLTRVGVALRASAENPRAVATLGWSPHLLALATWAFGCGLAGLAGVLIAPVTGINADQMPYYILPVLAAALIAGFTSFWVTLLAAIVIGIVQAELVTFVNVWGLSDAFPFLVIALVLLVRGHGLPVRGYVTERLTELGSGRIWWRWLLVVSLGYVGCLFLFPSALIDALTISVAWSVILLSVVVLLGYTGQLSLGQFALAGIAALFAAQLVARVHLPFEAALVIAMLGTMFVGIAFALPALRTRGINLAVITLGLAMSVNSMVFTNASIVSGFGSTSVGAQTFLGVNIDPVRYARRYDIFVFVAFIVASLVVTNVRRGSMGRRLIAVRTNERAAAALGISVFGVKLYAFALAGVLAGLGGVLLAFRNYNVVYTDFDPLQSILAVGYAVIGGVGFVPGAAVGAQLPAGGFGGWILNTLFPGANPSWLIVLAGFSMIVLVVLHPDGAVSIQARAARAVKRRAGGRGMRADDKRLNGAMPAPAHFTRPAPAVLEASDITVRFGGTTAVAGVSLRLAPESVVGLIGPNGAGKTTLIDAITGFVKPSNGSVTLNGQAVDRWPVDRRARHGMSRSFQQLELFEAATVRENLAVASDKTEPRQYITELVKPQTGDLSSAALAAVDMLELGPFLDVRVSDLPYGRRRLVAIARAIAVEPSILMLDEPAAGLSSQESGDLAAIVRRVASEWGLAILLIEHDVSFVMSVCDWIHVLDFGREIASGSPSEIRENQSVITAYLGEGDDEENRARESEIPAAGEAS